MKTKWSSCKWTWNWSTRKRSPSPSLHQGEKDVCVCVRLDFNMKVNGSCIKWLRLKIPATLIQKFEMETENLEVQEEEDEDMDEQESPRSDASSTEYDEYDLSSGMVRKWRNIVCGLDPINGPFDFTPLVISQYCYTRLAACAALGSIIYALGGDLDNVGDRKKDYTKDLIDPGPKRRITGPLVCGGRPSTSPSITSPKPKFCVSNVDTCHRFHFCDFSKVIPHWQVSNHPLNTPRFSPKLLSFGGKIYAFGGTHPDDEKAPFVEVYDPKLGYWEDIPNPPFGRLSISELFVIPLSYSPNILVLGRYSGISYKFNTVTWMWSPVDACTCEDSRCPCLKNVFGQMWEDLIMKAKNGGLDAIDTYVFWNGHEPSPGNYNFEGRYDLVRFLKIVEKAGLYAHLRLGPYGVEWNFGGFPERLKYVPGISFRTDNEPFKRAMQGFT